VLPGAVAFGAGALGGIRRLFNSALEKCFGLGILSYAQNQKKNISMTNTYITKAFDMKGSQPENSLQGPKRKKPRVEP